MAINWKVSWWSRTAHLTNWWLSEPDWMAAMKDLLLWQELQSNLSRRHQISSFVYFSFQESKKPKNPIKQIDCNLVIDSALIDITSKKWRKLDNSKNCSDWSHCQFPVSRSAQWRALITTPPSARSCQTALPRWRRSSPTTSTRPWSSTTATPGSYHAGLCSKESATWGAWGTSPTLSSRSRSPSWPTTPQPPLWPSSPPGLQTRPSLR